MADLALGPGQTLRHRRLGHEKGAGDLLGRHAGQRAQRQGDLRIERERRVAAGEHQAQPVVGHLFDHRTVVGRDHGCHLRELRGAQRVAAHAVEGPVAGHGREPGAGTARDAVAGPPFGRLREGILRALLGEVPVTGEPDQGRDHPAPLTVEGLGDRRLDLEGHISQIGLTSMLPLAAAGELGRDLDRLVEVLAVDDEVAAQLLLGLGERAVGGEHLGVAHADRGGVGHRAEALAALQHAALGHGLAPFAVRGEGRRVLVGRDGGAGALVARNQQQVSHGVLLVGIGLGLGFRSYDDRAGPGSTP